MKKQWMWAGAVVLVVGASAPWIVGNLTEQQWHQAVAEVNDAQPFFRVGTDEYQRGYLSSYFQGRAEFEHPETGERQSFSYRGDVSHGLTGSRIVFVADAPDHELWPQLFPDRQPQITLTTRVWGTARADLSIPDISVEDELTGESLNVSESFGWIAVSGGGKTVDVQMLWPGAVLRGPEYRVSLENLRLEQGMERLRGEVWTGDGEMVLDGMSIARASEPELRLETLRLQGETVATDGDRRFTSTTELSLQEARLGDERFGPHRVEFVVGNVNVDAWNELMAAFNEMQEASAAGKQSFERQLAATMALGESLRALAGEGFSFGVPELSVMSPEGPVTGALSVSHPQLDASAQASMGLVMEQLSGQFQVRIPVALAERYPEVAEQVAPLLMQGLLVQDEDVFRLDASLENLQINLNGQVIPLPPMI